MAINNLRNRPVATEYATEQASRGTGQLGSVLDYLKTSDPTSYFYQKLKSEKNEFLRDDFWSEAAKRGESESMISLLQGTKKDTFSREALDVVSGYGNMMDYDTYMLALQLPHLDNTNKVERIDEATGTSLGEFTDQEYAWEILKYTTARWDAELIEADKEASGFLSRTAANMAGMGIGLVGGAYQFVGDVWNVMEGAMYAMGDFSNAREAFLEAFANDDAYINVFGNFGSWLSNASFELQRIYGSNVNAVKALEEGYELGEGNWIQQIDNAVGVGAGYTTPGRWLNAGVHAIGYMLPTMILGKMTLGASTAATAAGKAATTGLKVASAVHKARSGIFYAGIFGGMVKDEVQTGLNEGYTLSELAQGNIIGKSALKAGVQWGIEKALGMILGFSFTDKMIGTAGKATAKGAAKAAQVATKTGWAAAGQVGLRLAKDAGKEALEETLQELSDNIIDYGFDKKKLGLDISMETLVDAFVVGAMTSIVMGGFGNMSAVLPSKRGIGLDSKGDTFTMGAFQTMNYRQAVQQLNDIKTKAMDPKTNMQERVNSLLTMNAAISTLGTIYQNFGQERATKAEAVLTKLANELDKKDALKKINKASKYADKLWTDFVKTTNYTAIKHGVKIKAEIEKRENAKKLKDAGVDKIESVVTTTTDTKDPNTKLDEKSITTIKDALKTKFGVEVVVGVNGDIVTKSGDVIFVKQALLENGDIASIIKGIAYEAASNSVTTKLSKSDKQLLLKAYKHATGIDGTLDNAVSALLFDKSFYTYVLLKNNERGGAIAKNNMFNMLVIIDQLIKAKITPNLKPDSTADKAYHVLLEKVQKTMQAGLVTYATQHGFVDMDNVSTKEILPAEVRHYIENHRNVIYTKMINEGLESVESVDISSKRLADYDRDISRFTSSQGKEMIDALKRKARSTNSDDRFDAYVSLNILNKLAIGLENKNIYLPTNILNVDLAKSLDIIKDQFGTHWSDILTGNIDYFKLSKETINSVKANGYNLSIRSHRLTMLRTMLYETSNKQFTISENGDLLQIIDKNTFMLDKYLDELTLQTDLISKKIKTLQDISRLPLDPSVGKINIVMDSSLLSPGTNGAYSHPTRTILLSETNMSVADTIMHEATHGTQYVIDDLQDSKTKDKDKDKTIRTIGGNEKIFQGLPNETKDSIKKYIKERYPLAYSILTNGGNQGRSVHYMYYMLDGELRANSFMSSPLFETGFKWQGDDKYAPTKLVSPSGDKVWNMSKELKKEDLKEYTNRLRKEKQTLKEVETPLDFSESKSIPRYVSKQRAGDTNLKYFVGQQVDHKVANFIQSTTSNFNKLPLILKNKIQDGNLNFYDLVNYSATARHINEYTFKMLAEHVFNNNQVSEMTFKEMRDIMENLEEFAALSYVVKEKHENMSIKEMHKLLQKTYNDPELEKDLKNATRRVQVVRVTKTTGRGPAKSNTSEVGSYIESRADVDQLTNVFMRHYDGTLESIRHINAIGKYMTVNQSALESFDNTTEDTEGEATSKTKGRLATWNWIDKLRRAEIDYEQDTDVAQALEDIDDVTKIELISNYMADIVANKLAAMPKDQRLRQASDAYRKLNSFIEKLHTLEESDLNQRYLAALSNETAKRSEQKIKPMTAPAKKQKTPLEQRSVKSLKDQIGRQSKIVTHRILNLKRRYNQLSDIIKANFDPKTFELNDNYKSMTQPQLVELTKAITEAKSQLNSIIKSTEKEKKAIAAQTAKLDKLAKKLAEKEGKLKKKILDPTKGKTMREKTNVIHTTKIINQNFEFDSREEITGTATKLLDTQWGKQTMSKVQGLTNNQQQNVHNGKVFFEQNNETLFGMSTADAEATTRWFIDANMVGVAGDSAEVQTFTAIKMYFLGYVLSQIKDGGQFYGFNTNLKTRLENHLKTNVTAAGTALATWNNIQSFIKPIETMMSASMAINGVELTSVEKDSLMNAAVSGDIDAINEAQKKIIERIGNEKTSKKSILRKITTIRSMSMLTSPITWLRNIISNSMLKRLNKLSTKIGNKIFVSTTSNSQFKMNGKITPEIQKFITEHFIDNKLFDTLVSNLGKYNPSDIQKRFKDATGKASKDAIFANMVIKSMYNQYYNENMFDKPWLNKVHQSLMKMLSDNNWVREASIRYFGKIIAERGYSLDNGVTDAIMNDFAVAIGLGTADYMHSDNMFNKAESWIAERSEGWLFMYKTLLPFASAQWNWFKAAIRYSPVGLVNSIFKITRLEAQITKAEGEWAKGTAQVTPELTEFLIRRDLGSGIIGTMAMGLGILLAALGYVDLEEDDYGTPKLNVGSLSIDISSIFGSSSVLAGAALVKGWQENGVALEGFDAMLEPLLDGLFLTQILELDQYNNGGWGSFGIKYLEQTMLSFIPNGARWLSGATYKGTYKTNNMFERAVARIPFFGTVFGLDKKVNPYTGDTGDMWDAFNRVVPFLEVRKISAIENDSQILGINKTQLRGKYEINGQPFELSARDTAKLNQSYGNWNAIALTEFYKNQSRHSVLMDNNTYRTLTYNQMTEIQRRRTVANIMNKNAEYAKIQAWLKAGNKYYASKTDYMTLRRLGVSGNLYKGTKGFISK